MNERTVDAEVRSIPAASTDALTIPAWVAMLGFLVLGTSVHVALHRHVHGVYNVHQIMIGFFLVLNLLVNFWEFGLYFTADEIRDEYLATKDRFAGKPMDRMDEVFAMRIPLSKLFSFHSWTGIWSSYALFDPGYSRKGSFGWNIDVGNGFSTFVPASLFAIGMTYEFFSARILGMIGIAMFWQMFYGTVVYFFQFFVNDRHVGHSTKDVAIFVGSTNVMWFIFPIWGMALSVAMVLSDSYAIFH